MSALSYTECEIDRGAVATAITTFDELHAMISGRSGEYNTITQPVGFDFSGLIGEGLRSAAEENHFSWSSAMMACYHASGVLSKINEDVKWYEDKIEEIKGNLSTALANNAEPDNLNIVQQIVDSHNLEADRAWRDLETRCDETEENLRGGPTPENIRALAEGGHLGEYGLIAFYATENLDYFHVDENQAETIATHIENAVLHGHDGSIEALEGNPEFLALIGNVVARALTAQQNGDQLLDGEIEFLETLFGDLEAVGGDDPGFLSFIDQVNSSEHISDSLREDLNRNLSNSMLVLSDENIGGGMDRLPRDVQEVAYGNNVQPVELEEGHDPYHNIYEDPQTLWRNSFVDLSDFLGSSGPGVQGGVEFSTALLGSSAMRIDGDGDISEFANEGLQRIIDVATRNPEANNIILTGENFGGENYRHHPNHEDFTPEKFLETFYTHDWPDDGDAVRGITDWISDYQTSVDSEEVEIGNNAFISLIELTEGLGEEFRNTGHSVEDERHDGVMWEDVAIGHLNPEIAESFSDLFMVNIDAMSSGFGIDQFDGDSNVYEGVEIPDPRFNEEGLLRLTPGERLAFAEIIAGSEETISSLQAEVFFHNEVKMREYMNGEERAGDQGIPQEIGTISGLLDEAVAVESDERVNSANREINYQNTVNSNRVDIVSAVMNEVPFPGVSTISELVKISAKDFFAVQPVEDSSVSSGMRGQQISLQNRATLYSIESMGDISHYDFAENEYLHDENGEFTTDWTKWKDGSGEPLDEDSQRLVMNEIITEIGGEVLPNSEKDIDELFVMSNKEFGTYIDYMNPSSNN